MRITQNRSELPIRRKGHWAGSLVAGALATLASPAAAQSLEGSSFTYEVLGAALPNSTGSATVGPGPEFTIVDGISTYEVDVDATGVTITADLGGAGNTANWGTVNGIQLGALRLNGLNPVSKFLIGGVRVSGTAGGGENDVDFTGDSVQIGELSPLGSNRIGWEDGDQLRVDFEIVPLVFSVTNLSDGPVSAAGDLPGSLRQAIFDAEAEPGADTIVFDSSLTGTITLTDGELEITESITIDGPGADRITVSGAGATRVFSLANRMETQRHTIAGLTIADGVESGFAGGAGVLHIGDDSDSLDLVDCVLRDHSGSFGSALFTAGIGSGRPACTIAGSAIIANFGLSAVYARGGSLEIINSTLSGNTALDAVWVETFHVQTNSQLSITNSTIADNVNRGVFIKTFDATGTIDVEYSHTIFEDHRVSNIGVDQSSGSTITINSRGYNVLDDASGDATPESTDQINTDPMLGPLEATAGTLVHFPMAGSPAIDAGDPGVFPGQNGVPCFDQRGGLSYRVLNKRIDIGAVEATPNAAACVADMTTDGTSNGVPDGAVTLSDFSYYLSLWSQGCP